MSKNIKIKKNKDIGNEVMNRIHHENITMKPRIYFLIGSFLSFIGLVSFIISSIFMVGLIRFFFRSHGPMGEYRLSLIMANIPWFTIFLAIVGMILGLWMLKKYDFILKINFKILIIIFLSAIITAGWFIDSMGINDLLTKRGPMQGIMREYRDNNNLRGQGGGRGYNRVNY